MDAIKEDLKILSEHETLLSLNQIDFIKGLRKFYKRNKTLTQRQQQALNDIVKAVKRSEYQNANI